MDFDGLTNPFLGQNGHLFLDFNLVLHGLFLGLHAGHHSHNTYQEVNESRLVWEAAGASGAGWAVQYHGRHRGPLEGARAYPCSAICCLILPGLRRQLRELTLGARTGLQ